VAFTEQTFLRPSDTPPNGAAVVDALRGVMPTSRWHWRAARAPDGMGGTIWAAVVSFDGTWSAPLIADVQAAIDAAPADTVTERSKIGRTADDQTRLIVEWVGSLRGLTPAQSVASFNAYVDTAAQS